MTEIVKINFSKRLFATELDIIVQWFIRLNKIKICDIFFSGKFTFGGKKFSSRCIEIEVINKPKKTNPFLNDVKSESKNATPERWTFDEWKSKIPSKPNNYTIPQKIENLFREKTINNDALDGMLRLNEEMNLDNFVDRLHGLLYIEEHIIYKKFQDYNKENVWFEQRGNEFFLPVKDLFEKRPSIKNGMKKCGKAKSEITNNL